MATRFFHPPRPPQRGRTFLPPQLLSGTITAVGSAAGISDAGAIDPFSGEFSSEFGGGASGGIGTSTSGSVGVAAGSSAVAAISLTTTRAASAAGVAVVTGVGAQIVASPGAAFSVSDAAGIGNQSVGLTGGISTADAASTYITTAAPPLFIPPPPPPSPTGSASDIADRIKAVLPARWFPTPDSDGTSNTPVLDGVLAGLSTAWSLIYGQLGYVRQQSRIATATGPFLDIIAQDFFGTGFRRLQAEGDAQYRARIQLEIFRPRATRPAMVRALTELTGRAPIIFEPANTGDTGGWGSLGMTTGTGLGYGAAGGYGSLTHPYQAFIVAYRATGGGIANAGGYYLGSGWAGGGYGVGAIQYGSLDMVLGEVTDDAIFAAIASVQPAGSVMWTRITN